MSGKPQNIADIRLFTGDQGSGKSTSMVAFPIDDYFSKAVASSPTGSEKYPVYKFYPYLTMVKEKPYKAGDKIYKVPESWQVVSPVRLFSNFVLFGVKYVPADSARVVEYINSDLFEDGWVMWDESVEADTRNSMSNLGKMVAFFSATIRKRNLHFEVAAQLESQVENRIRNFATTRILCTYDVCSCQVIADIRTKGQPSRRIPFPSRQYWPFFDSNLRVKIPEHMVNRTLAAINK